MDVRDNGKFSGSKEKSDHQGSSHQGRVPFYDETTLLSTKSKVPYICSFYELLLLLVILLKKLTIISSSLYAQNRSKNDRFKVNSNRQPQSWPPLNQPPTTPTQPPSQPSTTS
jgi:hypothetical protein